MSDGLQTESEDSEQGNLRRNPQDRAVKSRSYALVLFQRIGQEWSKLARIISFRHNHQPTNQRQAPSSISSSKIGPNRNLRTFSEGWKGRVAIMSLYYPAGGATAALGVVGLCSFSPWIGKPHGQMQ